MGICLNLPYENPSTRKPLFTFRSRKNKKLLSPVPLNVESSTDLSRSMLTRTVCQWLQDVHGVDHHLHPEADQELHQPALPPEDPAAGTHVRPTTTAMKAYRAGLRRDRNKEAIGGMVEL